MPFSTSDFQLIGAVAQECKNTPFWNTPGMCNPLKQPVVDHNCCVSKMMSYTFTAPDTYDFFNYEDNELRIWDATNVTPATGDDENDCGLYENGYGSEAQVHFYVNFGCTVKVTISGEFPVLYINPGDPYDGPYVYVYAAPLQADNHGTWSPAYNKDDPPDENYIPLSTDDAYMNLWIKYVHGEQTSCCWPDYSDCAPEDPPCMPGICDDYNAEYASAYSTPYSTEFKTYTWTYTCDVPCGTNVIIDKYGTTYYGGHAGTYVDVLIETLGSKCATA